MQNVMLVKTANEISKSILLTLHTNKCADHSRHNQIKCAMTKCACALHLTFAPLILLCLELYTHLIILCILLLVLLATCIPTNPSVKTVLENESPVPMITFGKAFVSYIIMSTPSRSLS